MPAPPKRITHGRSRGLRDRLLDPRDRRRRRSVFLAARGAPALGRRQVGRADRSAVARRRRRDRLHRPDGRADRHAGEDGRRAADRPHHHHDGRAHRPEVQGDHDVGGRRQQRLPAVPRRRPARPPGGRLRRHGTRLPARRHDHLRDPRPAGLSLDHDRHPRQQRDPHLGGRLDLDGADDAQGLHRVGLAGRDLQGAAHRARRQGLGMPAYRDQGDPHRPRRSGGAPRATPIRSMPW